MKTDTARRVASLPRGLVIAEEWAKLGDAVAPLSNGARPLARTVKLILDPLVLRPAGRPHLGGSVVAGEHVAELRTLIAGAGPALAAAAAWFGVLKQARRRARITEGNPQDLYFQRCYELAVTTGPPGADAGRIGHQVVTEIRDAGGEMTVDRLRRYLTDPANEAELTALLAAAWAGRAAVAGQAVALTALPDATEFDRLVAAAAGSTAAADLDTSGIAREHGLTTHPVPPRPELGERAAKRSMPVPFDRSVLERLFAAFTSAHHREAMPEIPALVRAEIDRCARPWQLGDERSRVVMALGRAASTALDPSAPATAEAHVRLRRRWQREASVQRVLRMPDPGPVHADVMGVRQAYLRRLWARLHGRELRGADLDAGQLWDLLDGVLRSVIMDQRDRVKNALAASA